MSQAASGYCRKEKWYNMNIFPLVPVVQIKEKDQHNTTGFSFRWLFFTFWSLDSFGFEFAFVLDTHWGMGFIGVLPYLRWVICIPCPEKISIFVSRKLNRKP